MKMEKAIIYQKRRPTLCIHENGHFSKRGGLWGPRGEGGGAPVFLGFAAADVEHGGE